MKVLILVLALISLSFADDNNFFGPIDGIAERMGAGSRELAKGNAAVADSAAFAAAYWNPGMLAFKRDLSVMLNADYRTLNGAGGSFGIDGAAGNRMGIGMAILFREAADVIFEDEDGNKIGRASPLFIVGYTGLGYRVSKKDGLGVSLSIAHDRLSLSKELNFATEYQSPLSFDLGWFRFWNEKWQSGLQIRNLGFNSKLSACWRKNPSRDNSYPSIETLRPKTFEAGLTHRNLLLNKPASVSLSILSYQEADTLFVFDPDWHVFKGRFGFEWRVISNGDLRLGINGKDPAVGWGHAINIGDKTLMLDYALNPLSLSLRMKF
ncbi:MAG: hypothetical protein LBC85_04510 [Fibromonadaceae bacterium]|jgi:hypothetical protein|nr:hypothetical protein [Fibromonadaceae bacterium]